MEGTHSGYQRTFHPGSAAALQVGQLDQASLPTLVSFAFVAVPANPGFSGVRGFAPIPQAGSATPLMGPFRRCMPGFAVRAVSTFSMKRFTSPFVPSPSL